MRPGWRPARWGACAGLAAALLACQHGGPTVPRQPHAPHSPTASAPPLLDFSPAERRDILRHGPWPPPPAADPGNRHSGHADAAALGRRLFAEPGLSGNGQLSCATCHDPTRALADGLTRAVGRELLARNTPTLWNAVHARWQGWDGGADSLWSQALRPLQDPREMGGDPAAAARTVAALAACDPGFAARWARVFGPVPPAPAADADIREAGAAGHAGAPARLQAPTPVAVQVQVAKALGAHVATLVSGRTAFDSFRDALARGDTAAAARYPLAAQRGLRLFVGRAGCSACHAGPLFSHGEFADTGRPHFVHPGVVDTGREGGIAALRASPFHLLGRWSDAGPDDPATLKTRHLQAQPRNFGEFRVPGLRNVALTAPYGHDGGQPTLEAVLQHYATVDLERLHADGETLLRPVSLDAHERADLIAFLHSLSDPVAHAAPPVSAAGEPDCPSDG